MIRKIVFLDRATADIEIAHEWYEELQEGLGERFEKAVEDIVREIVKFPFAYPNKHKNTRETVIPKFPYVIIYRFDNISVFILAVFPARMNPSKKY
jgi:plasmid stabilization system protein ParE